MPEPTQEQIEAAARAMTQCMFAPFELPIGGELWNKYLWTAKSALIAAAAVTPDKQRDDGFVQPKSERRLKVKITPDKRREE